MYIQTIKWIYKYPIIQTAYNREHKLRRKYIYITALISISNTAIYFITEEEWN